MLKEINKTAIRNVASSMRIVADRVIVCMVKSIEHFNWSNIFVLQF